MNHFSGIPKIMLMASLLLVFQSCMKQHSLEVTPINYGNIILTFIHNVNGEPLKFDTMIYQTSTGNRYSVNDLQYFISRVSLHSTKGTWAPVLTDAGIHYTDARNNNLCTWWVNDLFSYGMYDTISFTFGLDEFQNISGRYPDPPERDMFWPDALGGGYHYMKMDLKWKNSTMTQPLPFNFHLGIGQVYAGNTMNPDSIIGFVQNSFRISLPCKLEVNSAGIRQVIIQMNVDKWFDGNNAFDFAAYPNGIMQNEAGMFKACQNGKQAFSIIISDK